MLKFRTILHPTDFSEPAKAAFHLACSLARDHGAEVVVMHTRPIPGVPSEGGMVINVDEPIEPLVEALKKDHPAPERVKVSYKVAEGDSADEILDTAAKSNADLIVMGTHGRTGLRRALLGSVAEKVSRHAACPVLTVKEPAALKSEGTE